MRHRLTFRPRIILSQRINVAYFLHCGLRLSYEPLMSRALGFVKFCNRKNNGFMRVAAAGR